MENRKLLESDAVPTTFSAANISDLVRQPQNGEAVDINGVVSQTLNQNIVLEQRNTTTNFTFNNARGITLGTMIKISGAPLARTDRPRMDRLALERTVYRKTPTIKEMVVEILSK